MPLEAMKTFMLLSSGIVEIRKQSRRVRSSRLSSQTSEDGRTDEKLVGYYYKTHEIVVI